ncbi:NAD(P)-binding protein [Melanomma pulvis-pyrius CBS 109.77]|uniref:NAD(P)-binding protein n=1 Tax=Melanomma pulvis-pyrius CBS 109.77 TaxID=1314802 RepID=A0A6A6X939_9PLEO|nr:NAD(P)-binding protein [Melanomma pulvis-pyrius CBS 109.77]
MSQNILITGAAGYIGGSILADLIARSSSLIKKANISAAVRSEEQVQALSKLGINVLRLDLSDEKAVAEAVIQNQIDIVVHTASSIVGSLALNLIKALGQRREVSGDQVYFIHSSVTTMFSEEGGWPFGEVRDTDDLLGQEKQIEPGNPVRDSNILVTEQAKILGVTSFIVVVPYTYGRGTGECKKLSVNLSTYIRTSIAKRTVYKFDKDGNPPTAHISDVVALYTLIIMRILNKDLVPSGEKGYYFAMAHRYSWWNVMQRIAEAMHARRLVDEPEAKIWPSYEMAAESLGYPLLYMRAIGTSTGELVPVNAYKLGWNPKWDEEMFMNSMDDEVLAVLELDTAKASIFDTLLTTSN